MGCTTRSVALPCERHANSRGRMATRLVIFDERRDSKGRVRSTGRLQNGSLSCKMADGVHVQGARLERWASRRGVWRSCDLTAEACAILARYASWARGACWNRWMFNQPLDDDYDFTTILKSNSIALIGRSRDLLQPQGSVHASREPDGTQTEPATPVSATGLLISPC